MVFCEFILRFHCTHIIFYFHLEFIMRLVLHGEEIESFFDLLGHDENGLTYALGWNLANNISFLRIFLSRITGKKYQYKTKNSEIRLQNYGEKDHGFTDIELILDNKMFIVIEAKIGWALPTSNQLNKYCSRFDDFTAFDTKLVVISECRKEFAKQQLEKVNAKVSIEYISWRDIHGLIDKAFVESSRYQRKNLNSLKAYFKEVISMQRNDSNKVYCVSLSSKKAERSMLTWIDIINKKRVYFYPVGKNWPSDPPNYMAFRYDGKLQSIHHVDSYEIVTKLWEHLPFDEEDWEPTFLLKLGPPFKPSHEVKNGNIWSNGRLWIDLDTLFTCETVKDALTLTQQRVES